MKSPRSRLVRGERSTEPTLRAFAASVIARETLRDVASVLGARGIAVMPLKGVLFQLTLYADPAERQLTDVDVLVPEHRFEEAVQVLMQRGYRPGRAGPSWIEAAFESPRGLPLDLHRRAFCSLRYELPTEDLFRRARRDEALLGVPLWLQHPLDTLAHLVGKFVSDHVGAGGGPRLAEMERWIRHHALEPEPAARHLERCGLGRAARHVLARGARERSDPFHAAALEALPGGLLDRGVVALASQLSRSLEHSRLAPLSAHLLNATLPRAVGSGVLAVVYAAQHRRLARGGGARAGVWAPFFSTSPQQPAAHRPAGEP